MITTTCVPPNSQTLPPAVLRQVIEFARANLMLPEDAIRVSSGLPALEPFLLSPSDIKGSGGIGRFLAILAALNRRGKWRFEKAAPTIRGRVRTYFGRTAAEVYSTGSSNHPHQIHGTDWWVSVNNDGRRKRTIVEVSMVAMGFSRAYAHLVASTIDYVKPTFAWQYENAARESNGQAA